MDAGVALFGKACYYHNWVLIILDWWISGIGKICRERVIYGDLLSQSMSTTWNLLKNTLEWDQFHMLF